ncbi:MAG: GC-type dockerin domain-anchored protein [Phycisphaerales bacterium]
MASIGCIRSRWIVAALTLLTMGIAGPRGAEAQCEGWLLNGAPMGTNGPVYASASWDPDGAGPLSWRVVVAGQFTMAGGVAANNIAMWDPVTGEWSALGPGVNGLVRSVVGMSNGDLIAGGEFSQAGGAPASNIARWSGGSWQSMGTGTDGVVRALAEEYGTGHLVAGGGFLSAGGAPGTQYIARWNGSAWSRLSGDPSELGMNGEVHVITGPTQGMYIGGSFTIAGVHSDGGGIAANRFVMWTGSTWLNSSPGFDGTVRAITIAESGTSLYVGGDFLHVGSTPADRVVRRYMGWQAAGDGFNASVFALADDILHGRMMAGGEFRYNAAGGRALYSLATFRLVDGHWNQANVPADFDAVYTITRLPNGMVLVGGIGGAHGNVSLQRSDGLWTGLRPAFDGPVRASLTLPNGDLIVGGSFTNVLGVPASRIARWDGSSWWALGAGMNNDVLALTLMPNGDLIAGGAFTSAGGVAANRVARWNGSAWSAMGTGMDGVVAALAVRPNGVLYAGGEFTTASGSNCNRFSYWNGAAWARPDVFFTSMFNAPVRALTVTTTGLLIIGGEFTMFGGVPMKRQCSYNGATFQASGFGLDNTVHAQAPMPDGGFIAVGEFSERVIRWSPSTGYQSIGSANFSSGSVVYAVAVTSNGIPIIGGEFYTVNTPNSAYRVAKLEGGVWATMGGGVDATVFSLSMLTADEVAVGGGFSQIRSPFGNQPFFARYSLSGVPTMGSQPQGASVFTGQTLVLSAAPRWGYSGLSVQWLRDGVPIVGGAGGASSGGGTVSGAAGALASPSDGEPVVLTITGVQLSDAGAYTAVFSNSCGGVTTQAAMVSVTDPCAADLNLDGFVNGDDYDAFAGLFESGDLGADINLDGFVNGDDFDFFAEHFEAGC